MPLRKYRTIVADPPWPIGDFPPNFGYATGKPCPYPTLSLPEIAALPVRDFSNNVDRDAHLYLWTIDQFLEESIAIARGWGFHRVATIVWAKQAMGTGLGGIWPNNIEFVLFCRRPAYIDRHGSLAVTEWLRDALKAAGMTRRELMVAGSYTEGQLVHWLAGSVAVGPGVPHWDEWVRLKAIIGFSDEMDTRVREINARKGTAPPTRLSRAPGRWFTWPRGSHSEKPEAFLDLVESVSPGPYLEMFARRARFGWDYWGDESLGTVDIGASA